MLHPLFAGLKQHLEAKNDDCVETAVTSVLKNRTLTSMGKG
jgi:hypothetical protein